MPSTYSPNLRIELQAIGENRSTWGTKANTDYSLLEAAIAGLATVNIADANLTLTALNGTTDQARAAILTFTGSQTAARTVTIPTVSKVYIVKNSTTGGFAVNLKTSIGSTYTLASGATKTIYCDGTNIFDAADNPTQTSLSVDNKVVYSTKITNYTAVASDNNGYIRFTTTATLALTAAATLGQNWHCQVDADGGTVTIDPNSTELINGASTLVLPIGYSAYIICTGSAFRALITLNSSSLTWASKGIGELYMVNTALTGVSIPPSTTTDTVWIDLTAGLTGVGAFNNGKLSGETVSGSAPLISATATIAFAASPLNGQTVRLISTERRFLRPGSPGTLEENQNLLHAHGVTDPGHSHVLRTPKSGDGDPFDGGDGSAWNMNTNGNTNSATTGISIQGDGGSEARPRNIGMACYMRIK